MVLLWSTLQDMVHELVQPWGNTWKASVWIISSRWEHVHISPTHTHTHQGRVNTVFFTFQVMVHKLLDMVDRELKAMVIYVMMLWTWDCMYVKFWKQGRCSFRAYPYNFSLYCSAFWLFAGNGGAAAAQNGAPVKGNGNGVSMIWKLKMTVYWRAASKDDRMKTSFKTAFFTQI